jgi:hypothetical protein
MARQLKGSVTIDTTSGGVEIVAADANRNGIMLFNEGAVDVWLGFGENALAGEGAKVPAGGSLITHYGGRPDGYGDLTILQIKGITASGTADIAYQEL